MADGTIVFNQTWQGQQVKNVTVWSNMPTNDIDRLAAANGLRNSWASHFIGRQSVTWTLTSVTFIYNESLPIFSVEVPFTSGPLIGTLTGEDLPSQTALLVSTKTVGAPPNRGRVYLSGMEESQNVAGLWTGAAVADGRALVQDWADGIDYTTNIMFLRIARRNPNGTIAITSGINAVVGQPIPATQRRRRRGVGI